VLNTGEPERIDRDVFKTNIFMSLDDVVQFLSPHVTIVESKEESGMVLVACTL
jgi:hypothetical protein